MQPKTRVQPPEPPVLDDIPHRPQRPLVLVTRRHGPAALARPRALGQQHRDLGAQLGELERAREEGDEGASGGARGAEAADGVEVRVRAGLVDVAEDVEA